MKLETQTLANSKDRTSQNIAGYAQILSKEAGKQLFLSALKNGYSILFQVKCFKMSNFLFGLS